MKQKKLKIGVIAPPFTDIPPRGQGGTERIVWQMAEGLLKKGHRITLFGAGSPLACPPKGCRRINLCCVPLLGRPISKITPLPYLQEKSRPLRLEMLYAGKAVQEIIKREKDLDVVVNHLRGGYLLSSLYSVLNTPVITVLHLPIFRELAEFFRSLKKPNIVTISKSQRKGFKNISYLGTVHNGIDLDEFKFVSQPDDYFLYAGAIGEHKNPLDAILAAKKAKVKLILAGAKKREPYFSKEILPLINGKQIQYIGEVSGRRRLQLFSKARGFLFPIRWAEPFGLVMAEAMASGTPVIAYPNGAAPEVVKTGKTGFIVRDVKGIASAIKKIDTVNRADCREHIEKNFSLERMIDNYEKVIYRTYKNKKRGSPAAA